MEARPGGTVRPVGSLTRDEAARRGAIIAVEGYRIELDLTEPDATFVSTTTVRFRCAEPGADTFVDLKAHEFLSASLNGKPINRPDFHGGRLRLRGLYASNELTVTAIMAYSHDGEGLHRHVDPADGKVYLYAMSFLDAAPRWFACFDQPDLKAPVRLSVTCPPQWTVAGNAPATRTGPGRWELGSARPLAPYFTTLLAGPYHSRRSEHDGIPLAWHCRASLADRLDHEFAELSELTARVLDEFHRLFRVRYPWGEYHQAFVPDFNTGAMENPGCVTMTDTVLSRSSVSSAERNLRTAMTVHEMAHMWFGGLVTLRWWDDLWLHESFAEYLGNRVREAATGHNAWVEFGALRKPVGYRADRRPSTHPVAGNGAADADTARADFDGISYAKGASAVRQLVRHMGDDAFLAGLHRYFERFGDGNAELSDLLGCWTAAGAVALDAWADAWLRTPGLDTLRVDGGSIVREPPAGSRARRPHTITVAGYTAAGRRNSVQRLAVDSPRVPVPTWLADFVLPDSEDETWAKISLDPTVWPTLATALPALAPPARVCVWNALELAVVDAEVEVGVALDLVASALPHEPLDTIVTSVLRRAERAVGTYVPGEGRRAASDALARTAAAIAATAAPGSGMQLAGARAYVANTTEVDVLREWLISTGPLPGLVVDTELRWAILERLAALGALAADALDAQAARDTTSAGAVHAATCRALRPDQESKHRAWEAMFHGSGRSNYELFAIARGFWHPLQEEQTAGFLERYFADVAGLPAICSGWALLRLAELSYPWTAVSPLTLQLSGDLLARTDLDPSVRRSVADAADDPGRALAARTAFG
jgi:aminopeptidase N